MWKMVKSLDKKWKELLFSASGLGPNFMMVLMGAYYTDALNPVALGGGDTFQAIMAGTCFIVPALFPILYAIGKIFDGIIDIPFAHITDTLTTKFGRRRPPILVSFIPMVLSYAMCWIPIGGAENTMLNTIWVMFWCFVFFAAYTMCLICFYGSLSTTCTDEPQRMRVSGYKSFFDTINYCIVYALVPLLLDVFKMHIDKFALTCLPIMCTILIPVFMIKEGEKYGHPEGPALDSKKVPVFKSVKLVLGSPVYKRWLIVECLTVAVLQLFLVSMNAMMIGSLGFNGLQMALCNTAAFAPVPIMLYLFNKLKQKKGTRFAYQTCLGAFAIGMLAFFVDSKFVMGENNVPAQMVVAIVGGVIASWAIGTFFMMPYMAASSVSTVERKIYGINHSAMYFAGEALCTSIVGALAGSLVYENIKMLFISKAAKGIVYAGNYALAAEKFGVAENQVFNLGTLMVPFLVTFFCTIGIFAARKIPKDFTEACIAQEFKKYDPSVDISAIVNDNADKQEKGEYVFVQIVLTILSACVFGFIWPVFLFGSVRDICGRFRRLPRWLLSCLVPFGSIFVMLKLNKALHAVAKEKGVKLRGSSLLYIITGIILPILPLNIIGLSVMQSDVNRIYNA